MRYSFCLGLLKNIFSCVGIELHNLQNLVHNQVTNAVTCKFSHSAKSFNSDLLFSPFPILLIWKIVRKSIFLLAAFAWICFRSLLDLYQECLKILTLLFYSSSLHSPNGLVQLHMAEFHAVLALALYSSSKKKTIAHIGTVTMQYTMTLQRSCI